MVPEIKKILYATDLSDNARHVFSYAAAIANRFNAQIILLHAIEPFSMYAQEQLSQMLGESKWSELQISKEHKIVELIQERLNRFCEDMGSSLQECPFLVSDIVVKRGNAAELILEECKIHNCDMIVMGTHGHSSFVGALMGSTARRVIRRSTRVPVMVAHLPEDEAGPKG